MNRLDTKERARILGCLVEGNSIRATCRMTGAAKGTVTKLLADVGAACKRYHHEHVRNVRSRRVQCDEIWSFCYSKEKNVPEDFKGVFGYGDVWTWTAICADTKLIVSYHIGDREISEALKLMDDLRSRLAHRVQLTTDGHKAYLVAVNEAFGGDIDYAQLHKIYDEPKGKGNERRYSAAECCGTKRKKISGNPVKGDISTSFVERQNLTMRMGMRRFTRLTNAFSKKVENLGHAVALHFLHYNFARIHQTLRVTPAMEAGLTDHVWSLDEIAALTERVGRGHLEGDKLVPTN
jgi:IS1 family transposase